jgi:hypothetical protein
VSTFFKQHRGALVASTTLMAPMSQTFVADIHQFSKHNALERVSLIFDRRITKRTRGRFSSRVITPGVIPTLHVSYKTSKIKQYFKEARALRTETTLNNARDFGIGRLLKNLPALREIGVNANRRRLEVEKISQDCQVGHETFERGVQPVERVIRFWAMPVRGVGGRDAAVKPTGRY